MEWDGPETWTALGAVLFICYPKGIGRSKLKLETQDAGHRAELERGQGARRDGGGARQRKPGPANGPPSPTGGPPTPPPLSLGQFTAPAARLVFRAGERVPRARRRTPHVERTRQAAHEKKKPKSDKNKKNKHQPFGGKTPSPVMATMHPDEAKKPQ